MNGGESLFLSRTFQFDPAATVKRCPGCTTRVEWDTNTEFHTVGQEHGSERKRVRTNGSDENSGNFGVDKGTTS